MRILITTLFLALLTISLPVAAQMSQGNDTNFKITVKSRDAKFIGTAMGGARVSIIDRRTGDIIVSGVTHGDTGDTAKIMADNHVRNDIIHTDNAAKFEFSLEVLEPIPVTITAEAPIAQGQSLARVSEDMILIPNKDYESGNGIMLELPGFSVDILTPPAHRVIQHGIDRPVMITANVLKMCGCHLAEGSPWPPENYEVEAHIYRNAVFVSSIKLDYAGDPGLFQSALKIPQHGTYKIIVTAFDPNTKEGGMDATTIVLQEQKDEPDNE